MTIVHMIGNAHLDPVWLWRRAEGIDAAVATARSACDRLDEYPQFVFTCSASWFHAQVERIDADLMRRVEAFVAAGRWQLVGGMVVQPDCNLPAPESFERQLRFGQRYFRERFGREATVGYNVDSFGHNAYLPRALRRAGMDAYVFMRPAQEEKPLASNVFRWRSPDGFEVTAFRISGGYPTWQADITDHIRHSLIGVPEHLGHTMCFFGVGDHGGGPTRAQIEWIIEHAESFDGLRLVFSHPRAFFDAIAARRDALPVVEDELQHHAVGCYSVERRIKVAMRRAEHRLLAAEAALADFPEHAPAGAGEALDRAWGDVLFNQFHDLLGGTCIERAGLLAAAELGAAESAAEEMLTAVTRRASRRDARPGEHRLAVYNPAETEFRGLVAAEPWLAWPAERCAVLDEAGRAVPAQAIEARSLTRQAGLLLDLAVPRRGRRLLTLVETPEGAPAAAGDLRVEPHALANADVRVGAAADFGPEALCCLLGRDAQPWGFDWRVRLDVLDDPSDTWSHSVGNTYAAAPAGAFRWDRPGELVERGPLRGALRLAGRFGASRAWCRLMVCRGRPGVHVLLRVTWAQPRQMLRLRLESARTIERRVDLVSGGPLVRAVDRREYPLNGGLVVQAGPARLAVVAPEVFSASVETGSVNLTLLRSPFVAHHDPTPADARADHPVTDQGWHEFELAFVTGEGASVEEAARLAQAMLMPPLTWDLTG